MTTLISVRGAGGGEHGRRCDARCHHAAKPNCDCVCGGRYHGCNKSGDKGQDPRCIEDAELQAQGIDPRTVSPETKATVSSDILTRLTGQAVTVKFQRGRYKVHEVEGAGGLTRLEGLVPA